MMLLLALLLSAVALSCVAGDAPARATAFVLLGNWAANTAVVAATSEYSPWPVFLVVDYLSALILLAMYQTSATKLICLTYAVQCIAHGAYGFVVMTHVNPLATYIYWWLLYCLAMAQVAIVGGMVAYQRIGDRGGAGGSVSSGEFGVHQGKSKSPGQ